ncbi:MAG: response regulator transcription factor [Deltaproteobacteria bacterium]|nr:response regulator transcription factor [Deltaproteobacteria bacterium]MBN2671541.1 response regulator transcription factor [Deltaproteobacteria bacterium]
MTSKILVVDSDEATVNDIKALLNGAGFFCVGCHSGEECLRRVAGVPFDIIVTEIELPDMSGTELCRVLMYDESTAHIPLVFLSRLSSEVDRVVGLSLGATDYVVKPFSGREFVLRMKAILRRTKNAAPKPLLTNGVIRLDTRSHRAWVDSVPLRLTKLEFKLLAVLVGAGGHVLKREQIIETVWGTDAVVLDRTVDAHIRTLRKKMGEAKVELETVQGVGYRICQHTKPTRKASHTHTQEQGYTNVNDLF